MSKKTHEELMHDMVGPLAEVYRVEHKGNHKRPVTRREMLGQGMLTGATFVAMPSVIELVFDYLNVNRAYGVEASQCTAPGAAGGVAPFLQIEPAGGCMMAGDFVFGKQGPGAPVEFLAQTGYATIGWDATAHPSAVAPNMEFGAPFHKNSPLLAGLKAAMSPAAIAKTAVVGVANATQDDTGNNPLGTTHLAIKSTANKGQLVQIAGSSATPNGGRSAVNPIGQDASLSRALVQSSASLAALVDPGVLGSLLGGPEGADKVAKAAMAMSEKKLAMFKAKDLPSQVQTLVSCGYLGSSDLITKFSATSLDPAADTKITGVGADNLPLFNTAVAEEQKAAAIVKLLIDGNAAAGAIEKGGYDYHAQGLATTNQKQTVLGRAAGAYLEAAHRAGKPAFLVITTDGATSAGAAGANGQTAPQADSGSRGASIILAIGATARPPMAFNQIGAFNDGGAVNLTQGVHANSPANASLVIAANYAQFAGKYDQFGKNLAASGAQNPFAGKEAEYLAFKKPG